MKYEDRELLDQLAAQYVVGTMRGRVRRRFERVCGGNVAAQAAVKRWEDRMVGMLKDVKAEQPSAQVWAGIERRLGFAARAEEKSTSWFAWLGTRWSAAAFAAITALAIGLGVYLQQPGVEPIGVFAEASGAEIWRVKSTRDGARLVIEADRVKLDAQHSYELWALPEGGAPVSLGLLPQSGTATLALNDAQRSALSRSSKIAVSLEPVGGSPNGSPTQVLQATDVTRLG
jgi:anti-sigma-K factor RskA